MKKNYYLKKLIAPTMLLAVLVSITSCSDFIDAVLGSTDNPTTQPTQPTAASAVVTAEETTITISSFEDMANAVSSKQNEEFVKAIEAKAAAGEEYTINIKSEKPLSTENFEGFEIPRVEGATVNIVFDQPLVTSESSPLKITADEKESDTPTTAVNELIITLPDGADKVYLSVDMPETTVTLVGNVTYEFVKAVTATNTLIVESGVTIKELLYQIGSGASVVVKNGGAIETFVYPTGVYMMGITDKGLTYAVTPDNYDHIPIALDENGDPYTIPNLKVVQGITRYALLYHTGQGHTGNKGQGLKKLIIGDGAAVNNKNFTTVEIESIIGEGNAKFLYGHWFASEGEMHYYGNLYLGNVENLSGVAFSALWENEIEDKYDIYINGLPTTLSGCSFKATKTFVEIGNGLRAFSAKDCKFESYIKNEGSFNIYSNIPQTGESAFTCTFENCEFSENMYMGFDQNCGDDKEVTVYVWSQLIDGAIYPGGESTNINDIPEYNKNVGQTNGRYDDSKNPDTEHQGLSMGWWTETRYMRVLPVDKFDYTVTFDNCKYGGDALTASSPLNAYFGPSGVQGLNFFVEIDGTKYTPSNMWDETAEKYILILNKVTE